jgi:hypothetical protein
MKRFLLASVFLASLVAAQAQLRYVDWTSASGNSVFGTITLADSSTIAVTYTGLPYFVQLTGGTDYWLPATPYDALPNQPPSNDMIALNAATTNTLTFSRAVTGLDLLSISMGQPSLPVTYTFDHPFTVVDSGPGYWGGSVYTRSTSFDITGYEFSGVLGFTDSSISALTWTSTTEGWHGFTIAVAGAAGGGAVPEPSTYALFGGLALFGLVAARKLRKK